jgi:hypothetical protein
VAPPAAPEWKPQPALPALHTVLLLCLLEDPALLAAHQPRAAAGLLVVQGQPQWPLD